MDFKNINTLNVLNDISTLKTEVNNICNSLNDDYIYGLSNRIWQSMSKDALISNIRSIEADLSNFIIVLDDVVLTMNKIQKIQHLSEEIRILQQENQKLKNSQFEIDKIRLIENENNILMYNEIMEKFRLEILDKWR